MIELIKGQTVSIDNHDRGNAQPIPFDHRIHIHKRMNKDEYPGIEVFLYIATGKEMKIINRAKGADAIRLESEIRKAFKDRAKRVAFVDSMLKELNRKCTYKDSKEKLQANLMSARNIAKQFGLSDTCSSLLLKNDSDVFETVHTDGEGNEYFLLQDIQGRTIRIGSSQDIVENWDMLFGK